MHVDLATGGGTIALAVADEVPRAQVWGTDVAADAVKLARKNAESLDLRARFVKGDLFGALPSKAARARWTSSRCTLRTCRVDEIDDLPDEIRDWEPPHTLTDRSVDGMGLIQRTVDGSPRWLRKDGWLLMEVSPDRAKDVKKVFGARRVPGRRKHQRRGAQGDARDRGQETRDDRAVAWLPSGRGRRRSRADMLASTEVRLAEPWLEDGQVYWREMRPAERGRGVVMRGDPWSSPAEVTPDGFNVRTTVHEYGGGAYTVHRGVIFYSELRRPAAVPSGSGRRAHRADTRDRRARIASPTARITDDGRVVDRCS